MQVGIYLPCYDLFRNWLEDLTAQNIPGATPYVPLVAGSLARSLACATCYPIELARTRMQVDKWFHRYILSVLYWEWSPCWHGKEMISSFIHLQYRYKDPDSKLPILQLVVNCWCHCFNMMLETELLMSLFQRDTRNGTVDVTCLSR
jgi:hypothetical protein